MNIFLLTVKLLQQMSVVKNNTHTYRSTYRYRGVDNRRHLWVCDDGTDLVDSAPTVRATRQIFSTIENNMSTHPI